MIRSFQIRVFVYDFDDIYRRSAAFIQLVLYYREGLITKEELNQLSEENRNKILTIVEDEQL